MLLLPIVGTMTKKTKDKYSFGRDIRTDDLSGKVKNGYISNISQIFKIFRYFFLKIGEFLSRLNKNVGNYICG